MSMSVAKLIPESANLASFGSTIFLLLNGKFRIFDVILSSTRSDAIVENLLFDDVIVVRSQYLQIYDPCTGLAYLFSHPII